jgi:hypothetical protein
MHLHAGYYHSESPQDILERMRDLNRPVEGNQNIWYVRAGDIRPGSISIGIPEDQLLDANADTFTFIPNSVWGTYTYKFNILKQPDPEKGEPLSERLAKRDKKPGHLSSRHVRWQDVPQLKAAGIKLLLNGTIERVQDGGKMVFGVFHFGGQEVNARLDLISSEPKATIPTHANIPYGPHWQQTFDFYQAESDSPTPVAVAIHGGGWGALDKKNTLGLEKSLLDRGISVASVNYRFIREAEEYGV